MAMEKFHFTTKAGKKITLPKMDNIPFGVARKLRKESEEEQFYGMLELVADTKTLAVIDELLPDEVRSMMEEWGKDTETSMGESSAS